MLDGTQKSREPKTTTTQDRTRPPIAETAADVLETLAPSIALIDSVGTIVLVNESWRRFGSENGLEASDFCLGQNYLSVCDRATGNDDTEARDAAAGIRRVLAGESAAFTIEYPCHSPTHKRWFLLHVTPVKSEGVLSAALITHTSVTDRTLSDDSLLQSEERYRQSEEMLQSIFNASRDGILVESDDRIVYVNQSFLLLLGYDRLEDLPGQDISCLLRPDDHKRLSHFGRRRMLGEDVPTLYEFSLRKNDGTWIDVEGAVSISTVNGQQYITTSVREITERKRAEYTLRTSEKAYRELAAHLELERARLAEAQAMAKVGSWELNLLTNVLSWSEENYKVFGLSRDEFGGSYETFLSCVHPDDRALVNAAYADSVWNKTPYSIDHRLRMRDGSIKIVTESCRTFYDEAGFALRSVGTTQDITERKLAELALRERAAEFRTLSEAMPQIVWMAGADGGVTYINQRGTDFTGQAPENSYGGGWVARFHPEDQQRAVEASKRALESGEMYEVESRLRKADGSYHWMLTRALPLHDESGLVIKWLGTCTDIDEMKQALEKVRASEDRFRLFANVTNNAIYDWNLITGECWRSEGYAVLFGYSDETLGNTEGWWKEHISPESRERVVAGLDAVLKGNESDWSDEYYFRRADGSQAYILDRGFAIRDDAGMAVRMVGGMTDLTERHAAQEKLAQQAALIDEARDAMIVRDLDQRIVFWSKGAERLFGWPSESVIGLHSQELFKIDPVVFKQSVQAVLANGAWTGEMQKTTQDGVVLTLDTRCTLLRDPQGRPKGIFDIDTDITERKKLEQQFLRSQRMESVGTLAGGIAHDLNNILMPIMMGASLLKRFEPAERSVKVIENIERSTKRATELVRQVLSFARGVEGSRVAVHLGDIIREVGSIAENTFPKSIRFEARVCDDLWSVAGDPTQISQVLLNLCVNARDAMPDGGRLGVGADNIEISDPTSVAYSGIKAGQYALLTVDDSGSGMTKEVLDRIFEPFFTTKSLGQGTGLGLSTTIGIVRSHGGTVKVDSAPGKGTTFKVYFPRRQEASAGTDGEQRLAVAPRRGNGELILVVDDEPAVLGITKVTLGMFGYEVLTASSGKEAIVTYTRERERIALVLTDMMMPGMSGPELVTRLRQIDPGVVIVAVTGLDNTENRSKPDSVVANQILFKPYTAEVLLEALSRALHKHETVML